MPQLAHLTDTNATGATIVKNVAQSVNVEFLPVALVNSMLSNGATVVTGSSSVFVEGRPVVMIGCQDSQGRPIVTGSKSVTVGL